MGDNLHDLNRKELKELCSENNIRTAGVKHEDLVRLLRNKLYPSTPQSSRAMKGRGPKLLSPGKEDGDSFKTPAKTAGKTRSSRSVTLPREDVTASSTRKNVSGLSRKPLLTKSNTMQSRRPPDLGMKSIGVEHDAQENFVRRLCQCNGVTSLSRRGLEAIGQPGKPSRLSLAHSDSKSEGMASPRPSELSDAGSDASRRVSEIATDAGPDTMSDFGSEADDFRSVSRAADPDVIVNKKEDKFDVMESPMARDYVTYNRGSEADISDGNSIGSNRASVGETSIEHRDSPAKIKEVKHEETEHAEPRTDDCVDGPEIHSILPCLESHSPPFDSKDYSVAKKLVFEPEEDITLPASLQADVQGPEVSEERSVVPVPEENDSATTSLPIIEDTSSEEVNGSNSQNREEGPVPTITEERHSIEEPAINGETPPEDTSSEQVNGSDFQNGEEPVLETIEESHSVIEEPAVNGETPPSIIKDTSSEEVNGEEPVSKTIEGRYSVVLSIEEPAVNGETPPLTIEDSTIDESTVRNGGEGPEPNTTLVERDFTPHSKVSEPTSNDDVAETLPSTMESISSDTTDGEGGFTSKEEFDAQPHQQESDTKVPSETEHQDTAIVEKHVDVPSVAKIASDKAAPESDEHEGCPAYEQEGSDVKAGDGLFASTSTAIVVIKEEDKQVKLPFPLSFVMWCSQVCCSQLCCSPVSRNRSPMLGS